MILCNSTEQRNRIFDWVQTFLQLEDEGDLRIISCEPVTEGFKIVYTKYEYDEWGSHMLILYNSQITLFESFRKYEINN